MNAERNSAVYARFPGWKQVVLAISGVTFREIIRDKVLYNIVVCSFFLIALGFLASRLTFIRPERIIQDFGISALNISGAMIAIFIGAGLLAREFDRRTIHVALTRPISRSQFLAGKYLGLCCVTTLNWLLTCLCYLLILSFVSEAGQSVFQPTLFIALALVLLQIWVMAAVAIFFATFTTTSLSAMFSLGVYLIGNNISEMRAVASRLEAPVFKAALNGLALILPNLENFNLGHKLTYGLPVSPGFVYTSCAYAVVLIAVQLLLAGILISRKDI